MNSVIERNSSLEYKCRSTDPNYQMIAADKTTEIKCDFVQIMVTKEGKPEGLQKVIDSMMESVREAKLADPKTIKAFDDIIAVLDGKPSNDDKLIAYAARLSPQEKADLKRLFVALMDFYKKPDAATALEYARIIHEMEMRTCKVFSFQFTQVFRKSSPTTWNVVNDPDTGLLTRPCGIVNLSRFEAKGTYSWDYYARKAITNPNGQSMGGKCGETFDEREYKYESGSNDRVLLKCDYIKFGVL
jgi:hypothetical protein